MGTRQRERKGSRREATSAWWAMGQGQGEKPANAHERTRGRTRWVALKRRARRDEQLTFSSSAPPADPYPPHRHPSNRYDQPSHHRRSISPPPIGAGGFATRRFEDGGYRGGASGDDPYTPSRDRDYRDRGDRGRGDGFRAPLPRSRDRSPPPSAHRGTPRGGPLTTGWGPSRGRPSLSPPPAGHDRYHTPRGGGPRARSPPPHELGIRGSASRVSAGREGAAWGAGTSSNATPVGGAGRPPPAGVSPSPAAAGPGAGGGTNIIPTGPRAGGWGPRGGGPLGAGGRGAMSGRGRGRGGYFGNGPGGMEDGPARSLARKVDAGGNAMTPDLMMPVHEHQQDTPSVASTGASQAVQPVSQTTSTLEAGELEEGEAPEEEGEMKPPVAAPAQSAAALEEQAPQASHPPIERKSSLHLGAMPPTRPQAIARESGTSTASSSANNTPIATPGAAALAGTPGVAAAGTAGGGHTNPYAAAAAATTAASAATGPSPSAGTPTTATAPAPPARPAHQPPIFTPHSFPASPYPEFDAEIFSLGQARLASLHKLAFSDNYVSVTGSSGGLRQTMLELKEAQLDLEMSGVRREEAERARVEMM